MHIPVLLQESIDQLHLEHAKVVVDGTFGGGGHTKKMLDLFPNLKVIAVDLDEDAKLRFDALLASEPRAQFVHANYKDAEKILALAGVEKVDGVLIDMGTSTFQLLADTRGFSFNSDTPLTMTFSSAGSHTGFNAYDIVNTWQADSIADIIYFYGEDVKARQIAKAIVDAREDSEIVTAKQLADVIESVVKRKGKIHPATKTFQALRIAVNDEYKAIEEALDAWHARLTPGGRISVITFHSGEDRVVKQWMKTHERVITKKPLAPTRNELLANPRSRSAKLRVIEKI